MELLLKIFIILPFIPWTVAMVYGIKHFLLVKKAYNNHVYTEREKSYFTLYTENQSTFSIILGLKSTIKLIVKKED